MLIDINGKRQFPILVIVTKAKLVRGKILLKTFSGTNMNSANDKMIQFPAFGQKYWKRHDVRTTNEMKHHAGFHYQRIPELRNTDQDDVTIEALVEPSWFEKLVAILNMMPGRSRWSQFYTRPI